MFWDLTWQKKIQLGWVPDLLCECCVERMHCKKKKNRNYWAKKLPLLKKDYFLIYISFNILHGNVYCTDAYNSRKEVKIKVFSPIAYCLIITVSVINLSFLSIFACYQPSLSTITAIVIVEITNAGSIRLSRHLPECGCCLPFHFAVYHHFLTERRCRTDFQEVILCCCHRLMAVSSALVTYTSHVTHFI